MSWRVMEEKEEKGRKRRDWLKFGVLVLVVVVWRGSVW